MDGFVTQVGNGYLISYFGFLYSMLVSIGLVVLSVLIVVLAMKETVTVRHKTHGEQGGPALSPWTHLKKSLSFYYSGQRCVCVCVCAVSYTHLRAHET